MTKKHEGKLSELCEKHAHSISLLRTAVEEKYPDLKLDSSPSLKDGTAVDDLFYLRYVLSSKTQLTNLTQVKESQSLSFIDKAFEWRNSEKAVEIANKSKSDISELVELIPLLKTGELPSGFPVVFLPVKDVDLQKLSKSKKDMTFREMLLDLLLAHKAALFRELEEKTRSSGKLVKSVIVYDLNGLGYTHIYQMKSFFELVQSQSKLFKALFPQSTAVTVIVNSPGSFLLKSLLTSSKQKVMSASSFISAYNAKLAVPDLIGGTFKWPKTTAELVTAAGGCVFSISTELSLQPVNKFSEAVSADVTSVSSVEVKPAVSSKNKRVIDELERQMVRLHKNKMFSINVLEENQKVNVFFSNMRTKPANLIVVTKEQGLEYSNTVIVPPGFFNLPLLMKSKGEVIFVFVDEAKSSHFKKGFQNIEDMDLSRASVKRAIRYGKKIGRRKLKQLHSKRQLKKMRRISYETTQLLENEQKLRKLGLAHDDKVFFRFEVTDSVVCGNYGGETTITEKDIERAVKLPDAPKEEIPELVSYDARSLVSMESEQSPSFFRTAAQILTRGW